MAMVAARIRATVVLFYAPHAAGGGNQFTADSGDNYVARAERYDMTLLYDTMRQAEDESKELADKALVFVDAVSVPTRAKPGSAAKIRTMRDRADTGKAVFCDRDKKR